MYPVVIIFDLSDYDFRCLVERVVCESSIYHINVPQPRGPKEKTTAALGWELFGALGWVLAVVLSRAFRGFNHSQTFDYKCGEESSP